MMLDNTFTTRTLLLLCGLLSFGVCDAAKTKGINSWRIDTAEEWKGAADRIEGLAVEGDLLAPIDKQGVYSSNLQRFDEKRSAQTMTLAASTQWDNWESTTGKVTPPTLRSSSPRDPATIGFSVGTRRREERRLRGSNRKLQPWKGLMCRC